MLPLKAGERYKVKIESISSDGNGVAHINQVAVFIENTVPNDVAEVEITDIKKSFAIAKLVRIITPSEHRIEPKCPYFYDCGGCKLQNTSYIQQVEEKKNIIKNAIQRIGKVDSFELDDFIEATSEFGYRNKVIFHFDDDKCGFYKEGSHNVVEIPKCLLCTDDMSRVVQEICAYARDNKIPYYNESTHTGILRRVFIRRTSTGEMMVVVSINADTLKNTEDLINRLKKLSVVSLYINIDKRRKSTMLSNDNRLLFGKETLYEEVMGVRFKVSPQSFFQVNYEQMQRLYQRALQYADIGKNDNVIDVYCGAGTISLIASGLAKKVIGVEKVKEAIADANENAELNGIENARFYANSASEIVPRLTNERADIVILDPPRTGSDEKTLSAILKMAPKRIVYISCNPSTLARDLKILSDGGYTINKSTGIDMFPQSQHIECCVELCRK